MPDFPKLSSHAQRWVTGILIAVPVVGCIVAGPPWSWWLLVSTATLIGLWEFQGLLFTDPLERKWQILSYAAGLAIPLASSIWGHTGLNAALVAAIFAAFSVMLFSSPLDSGQVPRIASLSLIWFYVPYLLSFALLIGSAPQGRSWIVFVLAVIIAGDAGAYQVGRKIGKHKLYEAVSPKKTIEGAIGGLLCSIIIGTVFGLIFLRNVNAALLPLFSFLIAVTGQIGDLIESMLKRNFGKKDSSNLLPGHGGILDRLDSLLFSFPVMWTLLQWAGLSH